MIQPDRPAVSAIRWGRPDPEASRSAVPPPNLPTRPDLLPSEAEAEVSTAMAEAKADLSGPADDPVLCHHCGRTARNGLACIGMCVADSGY